MNNHDCSKNPFSDPSKKTNFLVDPRRSWILSSNLKQGHMKWQNWKARRMATPMAGVGAQRGGATSTVQQRWDGPGRPGLTPVCTRPVLCSLSLALSLCLSPSLSLSRRSHSTPLLFTDDVGSRASRVLAMGRCRERGRLPRRGACAHGHGPGHDDAAPQGRRGGAGRRRRGRTRELRVRAARRERGGRVRRRVQIYR